MDANATDATEWAPAQLPDVYSPTRLRSDYATSLLASVCYGMYVLMCIIILRQFHRRRVKRGLDRTSLLTLAFTVAMIAVTTGWYLTSALYNSLLLAGGVLTLPPSEQLDALTMCNPEAIARDVFKGLQMVLADALLLWRAWIVWDKNYYVTLFPAVVWLGVAGASMTYSLICLDTEVLNTDVAILINLVQTSLSILLNLAATALIAGRLLLFRRALVRSGVPPSGLYTSLSGIFVESAALYTACGVLYLPFAEADSALIDPFALLVRCLSFLGPALIQLRIADGTAYTSGIASAQPPSVVRTRVLTDSHGPGGAHGGLVFASRSATQLSGQGQEQYLSAQEQWWPTKTDEHSSLEFPESLEFPDSPRTPNTSFGLTTFGPVSGTRTM